MRIIKTLSMIIVLIAIALVFFYRQIISGLLLPQYIDWAYEVDRRGMEVGKPLDNRQFSLASDVGINHPEEVRIVYVDEVPFPYENAALKFFGEKLGFIGEGIINNAQVFGYSIYVRKEYELNRPRLAHELVHVQQIEDSDLEKIVNQYFSDLEVYGYEKAPLELEAFEANKMYSADW